MAKVAMYDFDRGVFGVCCGQVYGNVCGEGEEVGVLILREINAIPGYRPEVVNNNPKSCIFR